MKRNLKLILTYDGTDFFGWQIQPGRRTVQGELKKAIHTMTGEDTNIIGAGRTDAGAHAIGQVANFETNSKIPACAFQRGLNSLLPDDIVVLGCQEVPPDFHARYSAKKKAYRYIVLNRPLPDPLKRNYVWHVKNPLDIKAMNESCRRIIGEHDFSSFMASGSNVKTTCRTVYRASWKREGELHIFEIEANGFLRHMVRNIVGTIVCVGLRKIRPAEIDTILAKKDRSAAASTAPAQGLYLISVTY